MCVYNVKMHLKTTGKLSTLRVLLKSNCPGVLQKSLSY